MDSETVVIPSARTTGACLIHNLNYLQLWLKAIEQYFHVVLFIMLYKVVLTFKDVRAKIF